MTSGPVLRAPAVVRSGYTPQNLLRRHQGKLLLILIGTAALYGWAFALFGRFILLQLSIPLLIMAALLIWLLPEAGRAPTRWLSGWFTAFLIALLLWPDYLALALPGLPWVTALRLTTVPLAFLLLISVSMSSGFRQAMGEALAAAPWVWKLLLAFVAVSAFSIFMSADPGLSWNKFLIAQLYWTSIFFISCFLFREPGKAIQFAGIVLACTVVLAVMGILEARQQGVLWAGYIPTFLQVEDDNVKRILSGSARAAIGIHRVQGRSSTPLGMAESFALAMPFVLHFAVTAKSRWLRVGSVILIPVIFYVIRTTDSRLGVVGFFMSFLLYLIIWAILRKRQVKDSLFGPALIIAFPAIFASFIAASFAVGRLRAIVWGTGAQQFSTDAREMQFEMGWPLIFRNPFGYGMGRGAEVLGFTNQGGALTIDTYFLLIALETGVIGFIVYYGMILAGIGYGGKAVLDARDPETRLLVPAIISLAIFFIIKSIFSQQENHPIIFVILGMVVALVWRVKNGQDISAKATSDSRESPPDPSG
jgi:hypothetical protein